ncbi:unnamed protein product, partial [Pocillopora meandrina]
LFLLLTKSEAKSCTQLLKDGFTSNGVYTINPDGGKPIRVLCDMTTDGGGWTVFQRRLDGSVDFFRDWKSYKEGFGSLSGEFWLGNDNLHRLTAADDVMLSVELEDFDGSIKYAEYTTFKIADEVDKYRLLVEGYKGTAGDSMKPHNHMQFSTKDQDNDLKVTSCAQRYKGAWWYKSCHESHLNGLYLNGQNFPEGINWVTFRNNYYSLKRTEMRSCDTSYSGSREGMEVASTVKPNEVSLTISFTYGDPRIMTTVFQAINFARDIRGRRLNGSVIRQIQVDSESSCRLHCVKESSCVSYNFGSTTNNKKFKCQLSDSDRFASFKNFTEDNKFLYRGVKIRNFRSRNLNFLHRLTDANDVMLRVDLEDFEGNITYAEYKTFKVADEADKYRLTLGEYSGTAGDSFMYHSCHKSNLNGMYFNGQHASRADGVNWFTFRGKQYSLKRTEMKVKAKE